MKPFYPRLLKLEPHQRTVERAILTVRHHGHHSLSNESANALADASDAWLQYVKVRDEEVRR